MNCASWAVALLLVIAGSMPIHAQVLTEKQFLDDTLAGHPAIAATEAEVAAASGVRRQAGIVDNPEIAWVSEDPDIVPRQDTLVLNWRLPIVDALRHLGVRRTIDTVRQASFLLDPSLPWVVDNRALDGLLLKNGCAATDGDACGHCAELAARAVRPRSPHVVPR